MDPKEKKVKEEELNVEGNSQSCGRPTAKRTSRGNRSADS